MLKIDHKRKSQSIQICERAKTARMMNVDEQMACEAIEVPYSVVEATEALRFDHEIDLCNDINQVKMYCRRLRDEIAKLKEELSDTNSQLDKFKSVYNSGKMNELYSVPLSPKLQKKPRNTRLMGISAEPQTSVSYQDLINTKFPEYEKDESVRKLIENAIRENDFMKNLDQVQVKEITSCMYPVNFAKNELIIREGDVGKSVYVMESGSLQVLKNNQPIHIMGKGKIFGELAILCNTTRTATIKAIEECKLWAIDRECFQTIMMKTGLIKQKDFMKFLSTVSLFKEFPEDSMSRVIDCLEETNFKKGDYIIRQGAKGDTFYIINKGKVKVTMTDKGDNENFVRYLTKGEFFGEKALKEEEVRTANVVADSDEVECLAIDRNLFNQLFSNLKEIVSKTYDQDLLERKQLDAKFEKVGLNDLVRHVTLGAGGFGSVELVTVNGQKESSYALKVMKKALIVETNQQQHILSEKEVMMESNCQFIVKLFKTFKDPKYLYMLMEVCLGGELWTVLRNRGQFDEPTSRFYTACVIEAVDYLHKKNIIYRDLKPENILLDRYGYIKLTDFGFAKKLVPGRKTWTFCGTAEYIPIEIILNKGHDYSADYWSLGVLMYEFLTGVPPFTGSEAMETYKMILKGIDKIDFPRSISKNATSLIKKLCRENPAERLGYQRGGVEDIKRHRWFDGFYWEGLLTRRISAPIIPVIKSVLDTSNFDSFSNRSSLPPADDFSGWDSEF